MLNEMEIQEIGVTKFPHVWKTLKSRMSNIFWVSLDRITCVDRLCIRRLEEKCSRDRNPGSWVRQEVYWIHCGAAMCADERPFA